MADIRHSIQVAAAAETIHPLVSTAKGFTRWWAADVSESAGAVELGFFKRQTVYRLTLQTKDPPRRAEWLCETGDQWSGTKLVFDLASSGSGTLVRFAHAGWPAETDYFVSCNTTWGELMFRLKAAAEGNASLPLFLPESLASY
jgi:hypothetical protein